MCFTGVDQWPFMDRVERLAFGADRATLLICPGVASAYNGRRVYNSKYLFLQSLLTAILGHRYPVRLLLCAKIWLVFRAKM